MGLPLPELPPIKLIWMVAIDTLAISIVSYTVTISMALIFAKKQNYEVRPNQELLAMVGLDLHWSFGKNQLTWNFYPFFSGIIKYRWRYVCMCSECNISVTIADSGTNGRSFANCIGCFCISDCDHPFMDCAIFWSFAKGIYYTHLIYFCTIKLIRNIRFSIGFIAVRIIRHYCCCFKRNVHTGGAIDPVP